MLCFSNSIFVTTVFKILDFDLPQQVKSKNGSKPPTMYFNRTQQNRKNIPKFSSFARHLKQGPKRAFAYFNTPYLVKCYLEEQSKSEIQLCEDQFTSQSIQPSLAWKMSPAEELKLRSLLLAHFKLHRKATSYANALGLHGLPDIEDWIPLETAALYDSDAHCEYTGMILESGVLDIPEDPLYEGIHHYYKPASYLAAAMLLTGYDANGVTEAIGRLRIMENKKHKFERFGRIKNRVGKLVGDFPNDFLLFVPFAAM
ncbi:hypothetical protein N7462_011536 [Penicillium macrosclerotiorum]|uniref:uncharacterized protein n=1 Tax=Penicillium macrosclerotiorum TaxID=303699 RepID=UPI002547A7ED|nr:uncharacterized protein N7462_011536 [Penicillium macrosclerotiorum]KAJ5664723.1 hypothetical protein N7462_011536 [Penicillium macrosclerotiorum]